MARLLHDTRDGMFLDGSVLSAITIGIAVEAAFSPSVLRPSAAGLACGALLAGLIMCWLRAGVLLALAGQCSTSSTTSDGGPALRSIRAGYGGWRFRRLRKTWTHGPG